MNGANFQQWSGNCRWGSYGKNKLRSRTYKKLYLLWRKVDCPLRNVRSVCSPSSAPSLLPPSPHKLNCYSEKGKARWFWGLAVRKGPNFTSRLLLNSSADWQRYRIRAIWELFGSLGPVPNEQVLTRKKAACTSVLQAQSAAGSWVLPHPPQHLLPPQETVHPTLHTQPRSVPSGSKPNKINQSNVLKVLTSLQMWWFHNTLPHF